MFRIAEIDAFTVAVPLSQPVKMAGVTIAAADNLIVRVHDGDGRVGWGEASSAPTMTGELPEGMRAAARYMAAQLEGRDIEAPEAIGALLEGLIVGNHGPKAALEMALLDLWGQAADLPLYALLGGAARRQTDILTMVAGGDLIEEVNNARAQADNGFRAFKVKVGVNPPERDLERAHAIRDALGGGVQISADANQGFSAEDGLVFAQGAAAAGLDFVEQLVDGHDLDAMAACAAAAGPVPLGADEGIHGLDDIARHHERGAAAGGSLKPIKLGGLLPVMAAGRMMEGLGMRVNVAGKVAETSIGTAAIVHAAMALPQLNWGTSLTNQYLADDPVRTPVTIDDGRVTALDRPGLGIQPDLRSLATYRTGD